MNIVRAWRDRDYRSSLNEEQLAALPENPAGSINLSEISEEELAYMDGGEGRAFEDEAKGPMAGLGFFGVVTIAGGWATLPGIIVTGVAVGGGIIVGEVVDNS